MTWRRFWGGLGIALNLRDPPTVPPYGWSYFDHIAALYVTLNIADVRANGVIAKARQRPDDLTWGDIFLLEDVVFSLATPEMLSRSVWMLRERLRSIASPTVYQKYIDSVVQVPTDDPKKIDLVRADLCRVVDVLHWYYALIPMRERIRKKFTVLCVLWVSIYTTVLEVVFWWCHHRRYTASFLLMLTCVIYSGIIGGYVSSQRRMQNIPSDGDPFVSVLGLDSSGYYLWLSPLLGAVFAVILMLMFIGGILQGTIFPAFPQTLSGDTSHGVEFVATFWTTLPTTSAEYGKLFVWAFLAGFAERLVPDSLDRLSARVLSSKGPGPSSPPMPAALTPRENPGISPSPPPPPGGGGASLEQVGAHDISPEVIDDVMHTGEVPDPKENASAEE